MSKNKTTRVEPLVIRPGTTMSPTTKLMSRALVLVMVIFTLVVTYQVMAAPEESGMTIRRNDSKISLFIANQQPVALASVGSKALIRYVEPTRPTESGTFIGPTRGVYAELNRETVRITEDEFTDLDVCSVRICGYPVSNGVQAVSLEVSADMETLSNGVRNP